MKQSTKPLLDRAARVARLIASGIEENPELTSADFLDLVVAADDLKKLLEDAHQSEYGV